MKKNWPDCCCGSRWFLITGVDERTCQKCGHITKRVKMDIWFDKGYKEDRDVNESNL